MKTFNEWFVETFDSVAPYQKIGGGSNWAEYEFLINDRKFTAEFVSKENNSDYELVFADEEGSIENTGKGNPFYIFSTILHIIEGFIKQKDPQTIRFSTKNDRISLYDNFAKKLADKIKYNLSFSNLGKEKEYVLSKE
jgi:hypothetical protein